MLKGEEEEERGLEGEWKMKEWSGMCSLVLVT